MSVDSAERFVEQEYGGVIDEMTELQQDFPETVIAVQHVHLSDHLCLESIAVDGTGERIKGLLSRIRTLKDVHQVKVTVAEAVR